jgi:dihydropteroate synthase
MDQNYTLLNNLDSLKIERRDGKGFYPLLAGVSRKSMIYRLLGKDPDDVLHATSAVNYIALTKGASILRVHDVKEAADIIKIYNQIQKSS